MSTKKSVFLSTNTVEWISLTTQDGDSEPKWSNSINASVEQLRFLLTENFPQILNEEIEFLLPVYQDKKSITLPVNIPIDIMRHYGVISKDALDVKQQIAFELVSHMNQRQQLAIIYLIQIYHRQQWGDEGMTYRIRKAKDLMAKQKADD